MVTSAAMASTSIIPRPIIGVFVRPREWPRSFHRFTRRGKAKFPRRAGAVQTGLVA
jgi:hypothetical protein